MFSSYLLVVVFIATSTGLDLVTPQGKYSSKWNYNQIGLVLCPSSDMTRDDFHTIWIPVLHRALYIIDKYDGRVSLYYNQIEAFPEYFPPSFILYNSEIEFIPSADVCSIPGKPKSYDKYLVFSDSLNEVDNPRGCDVKQIFIKKDQESNPDPQEALFVWLDIIPIEIIQFTIPDYQYEAKLDFPDEVMATIQLKNLSPQNTLAMHTQIDILDGNDTSRFFHKTEQKVGKIIRPMQQQTISIPLSFQGLTFDTFPRSFRVVLRSHLGKIQNEIIALNTDLFEKMFINYRPTQICKCNADLSSKSLFNILYYGPSEFEQSIVNSSFPGDFAAIDDGGDSLALFYKEKMLGSVMLVNKWNTSTIPVGDYLDSQRDVLFLESAFRSSIRSNSSQEFSAPCVLVIAPSVTSEDDVNKLKEVIKVGRNRDDIMMYVSFLHLSGTESNLHQSSCEATLSKLGIEDWPAQRILNFPFVQGKSNTVETKMKHLEELRKILISTNEFLAENIEKAGCNFLIRHWNAWISCPLRNLQTKKLDSNNVSEIINRVNIEIAIVLSILFGSSTFCFLASYYRIL